MSEPVYIYFFPLLYPSPDSLTFRCTFPASYTSLIQREIELREEERENQNHIIIRSLLSILVVESSRVDMFSIREWLQLEIAFMISRLHFIDCILSVSLSLSLSLHQSSDSLSFPEAQNESVDE